MKTMHDLVKDILSLKNTDLDLLAEALATYDIRKADRLNFLLKTHVIEEDSRRLREWNAMKEMA
jgi:hypothetical protein